MEHHSASYRKFVGIFICLLASFLLPGIAQQPLSGSGPMAGLSVIVGRPTGNSVVLSVFSAKESEAYIQYGAAPETFNARSDTKKLQAGVPLEFELRNLAPNTKYSYTLFTRAAASPDSRAAAEGHFQTQRPPGSSFVFGVQGDSHPEREGKMYDPALYGITLRKVAGEDPDFYITLGDDFSIERLIGRQELSPASVNAVYAYQRGFLGIPGRSAALFLVNGNHEQAARCNLDGTPNSPAVLAGNARVRFFPLPAPDGFYTGDKEPVEHIGLLRDYYAWTWGDALFVVIDPYWHSNITVDNEAGKKAHDKGQGGKGGGKQQRDRWGITLGDTQYQWLTKTLTESKARWKFVFSHHVLGTGRGGIECAPLFEWGGKNQRGDDQFAMHRPGWPLPIHQLMAKTGVTIFFQGHDHLFAKQELDGVVYQSCPNPADSGYQGFNRDTYLNGTTLPNAGHLKVTVAPDHVAVDYVRSFLPRDDTPQTRGEQPAYHYEIPAKSKP